MARLTSFSKFIITLLIVGVVYFVASYFLNKTKTGQELKEKAGTEQGGGGLFCGGSQSDENTVGVCVVTRGGCACGQYWSKDFGANP